MLDRSIPFYNTILRCDYYQHKEGILPKGFSIVAYEKEYEKAWGDYGKIKDIDLIFERDE